MMYPRGPNIKNDHATDVVALAARLGAELGADIVKTNYTGDIGTFKEAIQGCHVPVIIAGGPKPKPFEKFADGVWFNKSWRRRAVFGRNVFQHKNPTLMVKALSAIVHHGASVENALKFSAKPNEGTLD